jgi:hypothetical protein
MQSAQGIGLISGGVLLGVWGGFRRRVYTALSGLILQKTFIWLMCPESFCVMLSSARHIHRNGRWRPYSPSGKGRPRDFWRKNQDENKGIPCRFDLFTDRLRQIGHNNICTGAHARGAGLCPVRGGRGYAHVYRNLTKPYQPDPSYNVVRGEHYSDFNAAAGLISTVVDLVKFDVALDQNTLLSQDTKEQMFAPTVSTRDTGLPYGLGWFTQRYRGLRLIWHYGFDYAASSLILKVPDENITFIILANSCNLSRPHPLGGGDVLTSAVALAFLRTFVLQPQYEQPLPKSTLNSTTPLEVNMKEKLLVAVLTSTLLIATACSASLPQGDDGLVIMAPFTDEESGIRGVVPYDLPEQSGLLQQPFPGTRAEMVPELLAQTSLEAFPERVGGFRGKALTWDLYAFETQIKELGGGTFRVDLGLAEGDAASYFVALVAPPDAYDANAVLFETVFTHALYALAPLE